MLTPRHLSTLQAALLYWEEEMVPHRAPAMQPYFPAPGAEPLTKAETVALREQLQRGVRYALLAADLQQLDGLELFSDYKEAGQAAGKLPLATVLLPFPVQ